MKESMPAGEIKVTALALNFHDRRNVPGPYVLVRLLMPWLLAWLLLVPLAPRADEARYAAIAAHAKDLVVLRGKRLVAFKADNFLKAPYLALYFGAGWCPDCRRFSPVLVKAYDEQPKGANRFEVLLVTRDKTAADLLKFMQQEKMKWPALAFDKVSAAADLQQYYSGHGIPCLTVLDSKGAVVLQSKNDLDATEVLKRLAELLKTLPR